MCPLVGDAHRRAAQLEYVALKDMQMEQQNGGDTWDHQKLCWVLTLVQFQDRALTNDASVFLSWHLHNCLSGVRLTWTSSNLP
jgi:hypothetical protein